MIDVRYHRGIELPAHGLWLDPWDPKPLAFVSHAHSDHIGNHQEVILSAGTSRLMQARLPGQRSEHVLDYGEPAELAGLKITLLPAGHIFGSAQSYIETDAGSLLYTGDFKLRPGLSAEPTQWRQADTLIMETTYGLPKYRMPPTAQVIAQMIAFCQETLEEGGVPVLLGYSLGKAQEILCALVEAGLTPMLHGAVHRMTEIYSALRPEFPCNYLRYAAGEVAGKVLICPPSANRSVMVTRIKQRRTAVLTGWALDPGAIYRYQCDAAFPLTDHADYPDLLRYVELVQPKRVLTLHGFASAFARDLRARGVEAWALSQENQLELTLDEPRAAQVAVLALPKTEAVSEPPPASEFLDFAELGERIAATMSKLKKIELLGAYFRSLPPDGLRLAATYFTGRAFAQSDPRTLQVGGSIIHRALLAVSKIGERQLREISRTHSDAGRTAHDALLGRTKPEPFSLSESGNFFAEIQRARGPLQKGALLEARLSRLCAREGSSLVKILTGDLRIGLKEGLVEEAIAHAFSAGIDEVKEASMLIGDIGEVAVLAARQALSEATLRLFRPIKCMLASPEPTGLAIWSRITEASPGQQAQHRFWAEDKFDGIRALIHLGDGRVEIFTRDLRLVTDQFADLARSARSFARSAILDGEILAFEEGRKLTFFDLQKRLGRKTGDDLFIRSSDIPVAFRAFDLLFLDGQSLLGHPLHARREQLESLDLPSPLEVAQIIPIDSPAAIENAFENARLRGNEGLIIKDGASIYSPGRRGLAWLKLKKELATLDVIVVGAETGHGRRSQVLSDYTFAVRDENTGALLTIGKAYSGLTDEEIETLTEHFESSTLVNHGRYREVRPEIVLEIAFDSIQPSRRHASGLALRFPRIKAIRRDKTPDQIDTLKYAQSLSVGSSSKATPTLESTP